MTTSMLVLVKIVVTGRTSGWQHIYYITDHGIYFIVDIDNNRAVKMRCTIGQFERRIATMYGDDWTITYKGGFIAEHVMKDINDIRQNET